MYTYRVGQVIPNFIHHSEGIQFDIADNGATMIIFFDRPKEKEIKQFEAGNQFIIGFTELNGVIMLTIKIGNLNWMDTSYSPHLSKNLTRFELPGEGKGLSLVLYLVDSNKGVIEYMRLISLTTDFTRKLFGVAMEQKMSPFSQIDYLKRVKQIYAKYSTNQIVKMTKNFCKLN